MMKVESFLERTLEVDGWPVRLTTYKAGDVYHTRADNVSPGATLARTTGATQEEAETRAIEEARRLLARTRRQKV